VKSIEKILLITLSAVTITGFAYVLWVVGTLYFAIRSAEHMAMKKVGEGQPIVKAIEAFRSSRGELPEALQQLTPEFIQDLPRGWNYWRFSAARDGPEDDFRLYTWVPACGVDYWSSDGWVIQAKETEPKELGRNPEIPP
jgi:hypothetical protein